MEWSELLANFLGKSFNPVPSIALISMIECRRCSQHCRLASRCTATWVRRQSYQHGAISQRCVWCNGDGVVTFLANFLGKSLNPVTSIALISMIEMPTVQSALQASKLLHGYSGEEAELPTWSYF